MQYVDWIETENYLYKDTMYCSTETPSLTTHELWPASFPDPVQAVLHDIKALSSRWNKTKGPAICPNWCAKLRRVVWTLKIRAQVTVMGNGKWGTNVLCTYGARKSGHPRDAVMQVINNHVYSVREKSKQRTWAKKAQGHAFSMALA